MGLKRVRYDLVSEQWQQHRNSHFHTLGAFFSLDEAVALITWDMGMGYAGPFNAKGYFLQVKILISIYVSEMGLTYCWDVSDLSFMGKQTRKKP